jgi:glycosyltransferase involved in cell wall biosynthesis
MNRRIPPEAYDSADVYLTAAGDPTDPASWSGIPRSLSSELTALGVSCAAVSASPRPLVQRLARDVATLPRWLRTSRDDGQLTLAGARTATMVGPTASHARSRLIAWRMRRYGASHPVVQIGTEYAVPSRFRTVTFEDMTVQQAVALGYAGYSALSAEELETRIEQQRAAYQNALACCTTTSWAAESIVADYGIDRAKVHVVGVGHHLEPLPNIRYWDAPRFLFIGRDWDAKNGNSLLRAFRRVRHHLPAARLDIVGREGTEAGVTFHGSLYMGDPIERQKLEHLFEVATCYVMPSLREASAQTFVEAGLAGIPSIGPTVGGSAEIIGTGGMVVNPFDVDQIVDAMLSLSIPERAQLVGRRAYATAQRYSWKQVAERLLRALDLHTGIGPVAEFL